MAKSVARGRSSFASTFLRDMGNECSCVRDDAVPADSAVVTGTAVSANAECMTGAPAAVACRARL